MSGVHKYPTISFRVSPSERREIEAKILVSGMQKKDYYIRSCIYNRVCVVGKKETVYQIVEELVRMEASIKQLSELFLIDDMKISVDKIEDSKYAFIAMLKAIFWMLDGAKYLWQGKSDEER